MKYRANIQVSNQDLGWIWVPRVSVQTDWRNGLTLKLRAGFGWLNFDLWRESPTGRKWYQGIPASAHDGPL